MTNYSPGRRWCAALNCRSRLSKENARGISYFTFPLRNEQLLQKWLNHFNRKDFKPSPNLRICSLHFRDEDFIELQNDGKRPKTLLLKPDAVPTIFPEALSSNQGIRQQYMRQKQRIWPCLGCGKIYGSAVGLRGHLFKLKCHIKLPDLSQQSTTLQDEDLVKMETEPETDSPIKQEITAAVCCTEEGSLSLNINLEKGEICSAIVKEEVDSNDSVPISIKTEPLDPDMPSSSVAFSAIETEEVKQEAEPVKEGQRWFCSYPGCNRVQGYVSRLGVLRHMAIAHPDSYPSKRERLHQCSLCGERFTNRNDSANHAIVVHKRRPRIAPVYYCRHCRTPVKSLETAKKCELQHEKGTVECPYCTSRFLVRYLFIRHLEGFHKRPGFPCMACRRDFLTNAELIAHLKGCPCGAHQRNLELMGMILVNGNKGCDLKSLKDRALYRTI